MRCWPAGGCGWLRRRRAGCGSLGRPRETWAFLLGGGMAAGRKSLRVRSCELWKRGPIGKLVVMLIGFGLILFCACLAPLSIVAPRTTRTAVPSPTERTVQLGVVATAPAVITRAATARPATATTRPATATTKPTSTATETPMPPTATATNTATSKPTPTPTRRQPTLTPVATPPWPDGINVECRQYGAVQACAWVSNNSPSRYSNVTVYARLIVGAEVISGAAVKTTWHYRSSKPTQDCTTEADGIGHCMRNIGGATGGTTVTVDVSATYKGKVYYARTRFTP